MHNSVVSHPYTLLNNDISGEWHIFLYQIYYLIDYISAGYINTLHPFSFIQTATKQQENFAVYQKKIIQHTTTSCSFRSDSHGSFPLASCIFFSSIPRYWAVFITSSDAMFFNLRTRLFPVSATIQALQSSQNKSLYFLLICWLS